MTTKLNLSDLPDEVTDYAFDQFEDRLAGYGRVDSVKTVLEEESVEMDYEAQTFELPPEDQTSGLRRGILKQVLADALSEKINDIEYEVEHGERADFELEEVHSMRRVLDDLF